jgi:hypothetical protein
VEQVVDRPLIVRVLAVMRRLNRPIGRYQEVRWKTSYATLGHSPKLRLISLEITLNGGWPSPRIEDGSYGLLDTIPAIESVGRVAYDIEREAALIGKQLGVRRVEDNDFPDARRNDIAVPNDKTLEVKVTDRTAGKPSEL